MSNRKEILIVVLVMVVAVLSVLFAESGAYSLTSGGCGGSSLSVSYKDTDMESLRGFSFTETKSGYTVFMEDESGQCHTVDIILDVQTMGIEGSCWMPLYKRLNCHYSGTAVTTGNQMDISFDGHFDGFSVSGFCSPFAARRIARHKVMDDIERMIEDHFQTVARHVQGESNSG